MKRILIALTSMALVLPAIAADPQVSYPAGYRNWHHVKSMVVDKGHPLHEAFGGIHHLYANPKAVAGYKSGKFPDGATIVFDLLEANSADNAVTLGCATGCRVSTSRPVVVRVHNSGWADGSWAVDADPGILTVAPAARGTIAGWQTRKVVLQPTGALKGWTTVKLRGSGGGTKVVRILVN